MEKEMLKLYIYQMIALKSHDSKLFCLDEFINMMNDSLKIIESENIGVLDKKINDLCIQYKNSHNKEHPIQNLQKELMNFGEEKYIETLKNSILLMKCYNNSRRRNYDSLYLIASDDDIDYFADKIIFDNYTLNELLKLSEEMIENNKRIITLKLIIAIKYYKDKNYEKSFEYLNEIEKYNNDAKYMLAKFYQFGKGVKQDKQKAYALFKELMSKDIIAEYMVAICLYDGIGTDKDYDKAFNMCNKLFGKLPYDLNYVVESLLGEMYFYGLGTKQDKKKGFDLLEEAWNSNSIALNYKDIKKVLIDYYNITA